MYPWRAEHPLGGVHEAPGFFQPMVKTMSPMHKAVGEMPVEGDKCSVVLYLFSIWFVYAAHSCPEAPGEHVLKHTRAMNMGCTCCFTGHLHMPNKSLLISTESLERLLLLLHASSLLLVTQFSLNAFTLSNSIDRPVCWLQIIIIV